MPKVKFLLPAFALAALLLTARGALSSELSGEHFSCVDIAGVDFKNATIHFTETEVVSFDSNRACPRDPEAGRCCVEYSIIKSDVLRPSPQDSFRVLVVNKNSLCGSWSSDYLLVFTCSDGQLHLVVSKEYDGGFRYESKASTEFVVTSSQWKDGDPHASPSLNKIETFRWDTGKKTFEVTGTRIEER